jgi:hypothetical protein
MSEWKDVGQVLLGSWPSQVASWGREGIAAYLVELQGRDLTPDAVIVALRSSESKWPLAASEVAAATRIDPFRPTFDEAYPAIYRCAARGVLDVGLHPLVASFISRQGLLRLGSLPLDCSEWGNKHRCDLEGSWNAHVEAMDGREVAQLAGGRGELGRLDPLAALGLTEPVAIEEQTA